MRLAELVLLLTVLFNGLADLPGLYNLGPFSAMGLLTLVYAGASWLLLMVRFSSTRAAARATTPFALFLIWGGSTYMWHETGSFGYQNLAVIVAMLGLTLLSARESYRAPRLPWRIGWTLGAATLLAAGLYAVAVLRHGPGTDAILGARTYGLLALVGLAWFLSGWRYGSSFGLWAAVGVLALVTLSLSRLALVAGIAMFPLAMLGSGRLVQWVRAAVWSAVAVAVLVAIIVTFEPLRARFFEGDLSISAGNQAINASGRTRFWAITLESFWESPWVGKGAGSAGSIIEAASLKVGHPHSDYLRLLHDYGLVGFALWVFGFGRLFRMTWSAWRRSDRNGDPEARLHLAAFLASVAVALGMSTDNAMVYVFVMAPFGIMLGASLGRMRLAAVREHARLPAARAVLTR